jgi:hypothetical protein
MSGFKGGVAALPDSTGCQSTMKDNMITWDSRVMLHISMPSEMRQG